MKTRKIPRFNIKYQDNKQIFRGILKKLKQEGLYQPNLLFRSIKHKYLEALLKYGTDRAGVDGRVESHSGDTPLFKIRGCYFCFNSR